MNSWFSAPDRQDALRAECASWVGTRFFDTVCGRSAKGVSADCVGFCERVYVALGVMKPVEWPSYVTHHGGPQMLQLLLEEISKVPGLMVVWHTGAPEEYHRVLFPGDLMLISSGKALHHVAIYGGSNNLWHCTSAKGVSQTNIFDRLVAENLRRIYRFTA